MSIYKKLFAATAAITILLLGTICFKLVTIENQLRQLELTIQTAQNNTISNVDNSINEIKESLLPKNQLLMSHNVEYGELNQKTMEVPVTVTIVPRQFDKQTVIELIVNDTRMKMKDTGTAFTQTIDTDIFKAVKVEVILTKGDIRQAITLQELEMIWGNYTLNIGGSLYGGAEYIPDSYKFNYSGDINLDFRGDSVTAKQVDLYSDLDGKKVLIASYTDILGNGFVKKLNHKVPIKSGQWSYIYAEIIDSMGLRYIYPLTEKMGINDKQDMIYSSEMTNEGASISNMITEIRDANGNVQLIPQNNR